VDLPIALPRSGTPLLQAMGCLRAQVTLGRDHSRAPDGDHAAFHGLGQGGRRVRGVATRTSRKYW
jgi:hypothetical protein